MKRRFYFLPEPTSVCETIIKMFRLCVDGFKAIVCEPISDPNYFGETTELFYWIEPDQYGEYRLESPIYKGFPTFDLSAVENKTTISAMDLLSNNVNLIVNCQLYANSGNCASEENNRILQGCYFHGEAEDIIHKLGGNDLICSKIPLEKWEDGIYEWNIVNQVDKKVVIRGYFFVWHDNTNLIHGLAVTDNENDINFALNNYIKKSNSL